MATNPPKPCPESIITLRPEAPQDEPLLFELYASTRQDELAITGWDSAARMAFLNLQFKAMRQSYRSMFPLAQFSLILANGNAVGRVVVNRTLDEIHVVDLVVSPAQRCRGIGATVIKALIQEAALARKPVRLQVLKNSRAIRFYQRLGFSRINETDIYQQMECLKPD